MVDLRKGCLHCGDTFQVGDWAQPVGGATPQGPRDEWIHLRCQKAFDDGETSFNEDDRDFYAALAEGRDEF